MATKKAKKTAAKFRDIKKKQSKRGKEKDVQLPDGYKVVGRAPNHDFDKHPLLEGERGETKEITLNAGTKTEKETRCCVVVSEEYGAVTLWESAGLRDLFENTEEGDHIRVEFVETLAPRKKGQQGMRVFACAVKE